MMVGCRREPVPARTGSRRSRRLATFRDSDSSNGSATCRPHGPSAVIQMEILMSDLYRPPAGPRVRVISDNDYAGDPDGLFQLAHHALSPSVELRAVLSSHLAPGDPFDDTGRSAAHGAAAASRVLDLLGATVP